MLKDNYKYVVIKEHMQKAVVKDMPMPKRARAGGGPRRLGRQLARQCPFKEAPRPTTHPGWSRAFLCSLICGGFALRFP